MITEQVRGDQIYMGTDFYTTLPFWQLSVIGLNDVLNMLAPPKSDKIESGKENLVFLHFRFVLFYGGVKFFVEVCNQLSQNI